MDNSIVLSRGNMTFSIDPAGEKPAAECKALDLYPITEAVARLKCNFELYWLACLLLYDFRALEYLTAVGNVVYFQTDEIASPKLAVNCQIKEGKVSESVRKLQSDTDCPHVLQL